MSPNQIQLIFLLTLLHLSLQFVPREMRDKFAEERDIRSSRSGELLNDQIEARKRPFCNAFTGCGRKRSNTPPLHNLPTQDGNENDSIGSLLDLNAEPAVEDLMRQIMSEAKLWEAIQEANHEISYQKSKPRTVTH